MRPKKLLRTILGLGRPVVVTGWELTDSAGDGARPKVEVQVRLKARRRGRCGRCGTVSPWFDRGDGERRWRHVDVGYATCELVADAPRVSCADHGVTVAEVPWARHDTAFSRAFEDLVVHDAIVANKQAAADRYGISWRAVNNVRRSCRSHPGCCVRRSSGGRPRARHQAWSAAASGRCALRWAGRTTSGSSTITRSATCAAPAGWNRADR